VALLLAASPWLLARPASAAGCPVPAGASPSLAAYDATDRLHFLQDGMHGAAHDARVWTFTWVGIYSALTVGQLIEAPLVNQPVRDIAWVGAGASAVGLIFTVAPPPRVMRDTHRLDEQIAAAGPGTASDPCLLLATAERLVADTAHSERFGKSWLVHVGNFLINGGLAVLYSLWLGTYEAAAIAATIGVGVGELQTNSRPTGATDLLARYRSGDLGTPAGRSATPTRAHLRLAPSVGPGHVGLRLVGEF
jgi:hypothetical protein